MKRQNFDASSYTDYIKKKTNTALVQSGNFKNKTSIISTPPNYFNTLRPSILQEYERLPIVQPVIPEPPPIPSVVTIIDDIPITVGSGPPETDGDFYAGGSMTITWTCEPSSEVTLQLYGAKYNNLLPAMVVGPYTVRETVVTSATSHTFVVTQYGYNNDRLNSAGTSMYITITPTGGSTITGRAVGIVTGF